MNFLRLYTYFSFLGFKSNKTTSTSMSRSHSWMTWIEIENIGWKTLVMKAKTSNFRKMWSRWLLRLEYTLHIESYQQLWPMTSHFISLTKPLQSADIKCQFLIFKVNFLCMSKIDLITPKKMSLKSMKLAGQLLIMTLFVYCHFWSTLFSAIVSIFCHLISEFL